MIYLVIFIGITISFALGFHFGIKETTRKYNEILTQSEELLDSQQVALIYVQKAMEDFIEELQEEEKKNGITK